MEQVWAVSITVLVITLGFAFALWHESEDNKHTRQTDENLVGRSKNAQGNAECGHVDKAIVAVKFQGDEVAAGAERDVGGDEATAGEERDIHGNHVTAGEENVQGEHENVDDDGGGGDKVGDQGRGIFAVAVSHMLARLDVRVRRRLYNEKETELLKRLRDLCDLLMLNLYATPMELHKAVREVLEAAVETTFLLGTEIRLLQKQIVDLQMDLWEERTQREAAIETAISQVKTDWEEKFAKYSEDADAKVARYSKDADAKVAKYSEDANAKVALVLMELRNRNRFLELAEWNWVFHRYVAWKVGKPWWEVARDLKAEGNDWSKDMHTRVLAVLQTFNVGKGKHFSINHWQLSVFFGDDRNNVYHDKLIRELQGAALRTAIDEELAALEKKDPENVIQGFDGKYDVMMKDLLTILRNRASEVKRMKQDLGIIPTPVTAVGS